MKSKDTENLNGLSMNLKDVENLNVFLESLLKEYSQNQNSTELIDRKEVCKMLSISIPTLMKYEKEGIIPAYTVGSRIRFKKEEVLNSLKDINNIKYSRG